jgi:hypothetical protein
MVLVTCFLWILVANKFVNDSMCICNFYRGKVNFQWILDICLNSAYWKQIIFYFTFLIFLWF